MLLWPWPTMYIVVLSKVVLLLHQTQPKSERFFLEIWRHNHFEANWSMSLGEVLQSKKPKNQFADLHPKNLRRGKNGLKITQDHFINQCRNEAKTDNFFLIFSDLVLPDSKETTTALPPPRRTLSCADQFRSPSNALPLFKKKTII